MYRCHVLMVAAYIYKPTRGVCVAHTDYAGNAKASKSGMSLDDQTPLFLYKLNRCEESVTRI